jgi:hypothetical protein
MEIQELSFILANGKTNPYVLLMTLHTALRYSWIPGILPYLFLSLKMFFLLKKLENNGDMEPLPNERSGWSSFKRLITARIDTAKNETIKIELEKILFWARLRIIYFFLFVILIIFSVIYH